VFIVEFRPAPFDPAGFKSRYGKSISGALGAKPMSGFIDLQDNEWAFSRNMASRYV